MVNYVLKNISKLASNDCFIKKICKRLHFAIDKIFKSFLKYKQSGETL